MIKLHFIILFPLISFKEPFIFDFSLEKIQMINAPNKVPSMAESQESLPTSLRSKENPNPTKNIRPRK